jgi:hypothetical protein
MPQFHTLANYLDGQPQLLPEAILLPWKIENGPKQFKYFNVFSRICESLTGAALLTCEGMPAN